MARSAGAAGGADPTEASQREQTGRAGEPGGSRGIVREGLEQLEKQRAQLP